MRGAWDTLMASTSGEFRRPQRILQRAKVCKHCGAALAPDEGFHVRQAYEAEQAQKKQGKDALMVMGYLALIIAVAAAILI